MVFYIISEIRPLTANSFQFSNVNLLLQIKRAKISNTKAYVFQGSIFFLNLKFSKKHALEIGKSVFVHLNIWKYFYIKDI